jgi:branched-chain amino acid transport system permease protein
MSALLVSIGLGLVTAGLLSVTSVGLTLQFGITNFANVAYCQYMTIGAFVAWDLEREWNAPIWLAATVASVVAGVISLVVGKCVYGVFLRRGSSRLHLLLASLAMMLGLNGVMAAIWGSEPRQYNSGTERPLHVGPFLLTTSEIGLIVVSAFLMVLLHVILSRTKLGKAMRAMSDNQSLARLCGIPTHRVTSLVWFISGTLGGMGGVALAINEASFSISLGLNFLFVVLAAIVVGGIGRPYGTMLGALLIGVIVEVSTNVVPAAYKYDVAFGVLIVVLLFRPEGLSRVMGRI